MMIPTVAARKGDPLVLSRRRNTSDGGGPSSAEASLTVALMS